MSMVKDSRSSLSSSTESETESNSFVEESIRSSKSTLNPERIISYYDYAAASSKGSSLNLVDIFLQKRSKNSFGFERERAGGFTKQKPTINNECPVRINHECVCTGDSKYGIESFSSVSFDVSQSENSQSKTEASCESFLVETTRTKYFRIIEEHDKKRNCDDKTCGICLERLHRKLKTRKKVKPDCSYLPNPRYSTCPPIASSGRPDHGNNKNDSKKDTENSDCDCVYGIFHDSKKDLGTGEGAKEVLEQKICLYQTQSSNINKIDTSYSQKYEQEKKLTTVEKFNTDSGGTGDEGTERVDKKHCAKFPNFKYAREKSSSGVIMTEVSDPSTTTESDSELDSEREDNSYSSISENLKQNKQKIDYAVGDFGKIGKQSEDDVQSTIDSGTCSEKEGNSIRTDSQYSHSASDLYTPSVSSEVLTPGISKKDNRKHFGIQFNTNINDSKSYSKHHGKSVHFGIKSEITQSMNAKIVEAEFNLNNESSKPFRSISNLRVKLEIHESTEKIQNYSSDSRKSRLFDESKSEHAIYSDEIEPDSLVGSSHFDDDTDIDESLSDIEIPCPCPSPVCFQHQKDDTIKDFSTHPFYNLSQINPPKFTSIKLEIVKITEPIKKLVMEYIRIPFYSFSLDPAKSQTNLYNIESHLVSYENKLISKCTSDCCHLEIALTDTESSNIGLDSSLHQFEFSTKKLKNLKREVFPEISIDVKHNETSFEIELATGILAALMEEIYLTQRSKRIESSSDMMTHLHQFKIPLKNIAKAIHKKDKEINLTDLTDDISPLIRLEITSNVSNMLKRSLDSSNSEASNSLDWNFKSITDTIHKVNAQSSIILHTFDYTERSTTEIESNWCVPLIVSSGSVKTLKEIFPKCVPITNKAMKTVEVNIIPDISQYDDKTCKIISAPLIKICEIRQEFSNISNGNVSEDISKVLIDKPPSSPPILKNEEWLKRELSDFESPAEVSVGENGNEIQNSEDFVTVECPTENLKNINEIVPDLTEIDPKSEIESHPKCSDPNKNLVISESENEYITINSDELTLDITYQELLSILTKKRLKEKANGTKSEDKVRDDQKVTFTNSDIKMIVDIAKNRRRVHSSGCQIEYKSTDSDGLTLDITYQELLSILAKQDMKENTSLDKDAKVKLHINNEPELENLKLDQVKSSKHICCSRCQIDYTSSFSGEDISYQEVLSSILKKQGIGGGIKFSPTTSSEFESTDSVDLVKDISSKILSSSLKKPNVSLPKVQNVKYGFTQADLRNLVEYAKSNNRFDCAKLSNDYIDELPTYQEFLSMLINQRMGEDKIKPTVKLPKPPEKEADSSKEKIKEVLESDTKLPNNSIKMKDKPFEKLISGKEILSILMKLKQDSLNKNKKYESSESSQKHRGCELDIISVSSNTTSYDWSESLHNNNKMQIEENIGVDSKTETKEKIANKWSVEFPKVDDSKKVKIENKISTKSIKVLPEDFKSKIPVKISYSADLKQAKSSTFNTKKTKPGVSQGVATIETETSKFNNSRPEIPVETQTSLYMSSNILKQMETQTSKSNNSKLNDISGKVEKISVLSSVSSNDSEKFIKKNLEINNKEKEKNDQIKKKSKIPKAKSFADKIGVTTTFKKDESENINVKSQNADKSGVLNTTKEEQKFVQFSSEDMPIQMPTNEELLRIVINYKKINSENNKVGIEKNQLKKPLNVCPECEVEIRSVDYDSEISDGDLLRFFNTDEKGRNIVCKNILSLPLKDGVESISVKSDSGNFKCGIESTSVKTDSEPFSLSGELSLSNSKEEKSGDVVSVSESSITCHEKWISFSKSKEQQLGDEISGSESCNICNEKRLSLLKSKEKKLVEEVFASGTCYICLEKCLSLENNRKPEPQDENMKDATVNSSQSCREKSSSVSDSRSCDICLMEWLNKLKMKKDDITRSPSKLSCPCSEKQLPYSKNSFCTCREEWLALSKNKMTKTSCTCREEWLSRYKNKMEKTSCTCREKWLSRSENKTEGTSCICREEWLSCTQTKLEKTSCTCSEDWMSLSNTKVKSICEIEYTSEDSDAGTCDQCLVEWLTEMEKNKIADSKLKKSKKKVKSQISDTKMYSDSEDYSLELSDDIDSDFGISGVSDLLTNDVPDINDLVLDEKLSDFPDLKLYEDSTIPDIAVNEDDCKCGENFENMARSSMVSGETDECCSCIVDEYDTYFFSRTPWGSTLDQATVGILRALSIFKDGSSALNDSEPVDRNTTENETGVANTIKWGIDFLRTQILGPTISESVITLFEGINYLTNAAYGVDLPYEAHSSCPKRRKYYQNPTTETSEN